MGSVRLKNSFLIEIVASILMVWNHMNYWSSYRDVCKLTIPHANINFRNWISSFYVVTWNSELIREKLISWQQARNSNVLAHVAKQIIRLTNQLRLSAFRFEFDDILRSWISRFMTWSNFANSCAIAKLKYKYEIIFSETSSSFRKSFSKKKWIFDASRSSQNDYKQLNLQIQ